MSMIPEYKRVIKTYLIGIVWLFGLLWPLLGIHSDGTLSFRKTFTVWCYVAGVTLVGMVLYLLKKDKRFRGVSGGWEKFRSGVRAGFDSTPKWLWMTTMMAVLLYYPNFDFIGRYQTDIAIMVLVYVCLGLGLNIVVGLAGLLDLGYIAFYGVGAYTYALLSIHYQLSFWLALPLAGGAAAVAGCIIGYPTLRMRGDYLAIVTLGFGEIVRLILNNWMELTNGPNGILGINPPGLYYPSFVDGFSLEHLWLKKLQYLYYVILFLAIVTIVAVHRLNYSRIGRAWEAIREDETAAELMGVNTFKLKLLAYAMGAIFGGLAGAFFSARMRFVSPESFTFIESAMVLAMVVLGGMASIPGILLGTAALIILPEVFRGFELYRMLAFGAAMTLMMLFRPAGLIPTKRVGKRSEEKEE
jgi:branched-chain amino acid transport system permease protein